MATILLVCFSKFCFAFFVFVLFCFLALIEVKPHGICLSLSDLLHSAQCPLVHPHCHGITEAVWCTWNKFNLVFQKIKWKSQSFLPYQKVLNGVRGWEVVNTWYRILAWCLLTMCPWKNLLSSLGFTSFLWKMTSGFQRFSFQMWQSVAWVIILRLRSGPLFHLHFCAM